MSPQELGIIPDSLNIPESVPSLLDSGVVFFSGMSMHDFGNRALKNSLEGIYGAENAEVIPSLFSSDKISQTRSQEIQQALEKVLLKKEHGVIVMYSMGAVEFVQAFQKFTQEHPESLSQLEHLDIVVMSPAGFVHGWSAVSEQLNSLGLLEKEADEVGESPVTQARFSGLQRWWQRGKSVLKSSAMWAQRYPQVLEGAVSPKKLRYWIETLNTFPPDPAIVLETTVWDTLSQMYPETSQLPENFTGEQINVPAENWRTLLNEEEKIQLDTIDQQLAPLFESFEENRTKIEELLRQRATLLNEKNQLVFSGEPIPGNENLKNESAPPWQLLSQMVLGFVSHSETLFSGTVVQQLQKIRQAGAKIHLLVPEYDAFVTVEDLAEFFPEEPVTILRGGTHITISNNTNLLAEKLRNISKARQQTLATPSVDSSTAQTQTEPDSHTPTVAE